MNGTRSACAEAYPCSESYENKRLARNTDLPYRNTHKPCACARREDTGITHCCFVSRLCSNVLCQHPEQYGRLCRAKPRYLSVFTVARVPDRLPDPGHATIPSPNCCGCPCLIRACHCSFLFQTCPAKTLCRGFMPSRPHQQLHHNSTPNKLLAFFSTSCADHLQHRLFRVPSGVRLCLCGVVQWSLIAAYHQLTAAVSPTWCPQDRHLSFRCRLEWLQHPPFIHSGSINLRHLATTGSWPSIFRASYCLSLVRLVRTSVWPKVCMSP